MKSVLLEDSTMREGEQSPGVSFTADQKVQIAKHLVALGVRACEIGTPAMGGPEGEAVDALVGANLDIQLIGWNRGRRSDLEDSFRHGLSSVHIGLPASDHHLDRKFNKTRGWVIETMQENVAFAKEKGAWVSVSAEDSGRADLEFLVEYARAVRDAGADRMRVSDTVGVLNPTRTRQLFETLTAEVEGLAFQAHMHNDFGLATANVLAAVEGGAEHVHATINGLGDRAGIAALEEVVMVMKYHAGIDLGVRTEGLAEACDYVAEVSRRPISDNKAIVGRSMFQHESGIHVDGVLTVPDAFEAFEPELVGRAREIVIGKHTGSGAVQWALEQEGITTDRGDLSDLVQRIRHEAVSLGRALSFAEVATMYGESDVA